MSITIVAHIHAKSGQEDLVRDSLNTLVAETRKEPGCLKYDLHSDSKDPTHFVMLESWQNAEAIKSHMGAPHMAENYARIKDAVTKTAIHQINLIG
jgi:quinol monooxygenase YgiN